MHLRRFDLFPNSRAAELLGVHPPVAVPLHVGPDRLLEQVKGRRTDYEITLFKSVGAAIEDLAAAVKCYENHTNT